MSWSSYEITPADGRRSSRLHDGAGNDGGPDLCDVSLGNLGLNAGRLQGR